MQETMTKDFSDERRAEDRLKDLERRVTTLEDRHEDIVRLSRADVEAIRTLDGNPPPDTSASDRQEAAEIKAAQSHPFVPPDPKPKPDKK